VTATSDDATNVPRRRRGDALLQAIYDSVLEELAEVGLGRLTMEGIAERAGTGKMPLYRRWASTHDLLLDAVRHMLATVATASELPDTGSLREDLIILLSYPRDVMAGPVGPAISAVIGERHRHPELIAAISGKVFGTSMRIQAVLRRAIERGEVDPRRVTPHICRAGQALLVLGYLVDGTPPDDAEVAAVVDGVLLPVLRPA
jgi:AcrR family transcriptional regulator